MPIQINKKPVTKNGKLFSLFPSISNFSFRAFFLESQRGPQKGSRAQRCVAPLRFAMDDGPVTTEAEIPAEYAEWSNAQVLDLTNPNIFFRSQ